MFLADRLPNGYVEVSCFKGESMKSFGEICMGGLTQKVSLSSLVFCKSITSSHPEICLGALFSTSFLSSVSCLWRTLWGLQKRKKIRNNADDCCNIFITTYEGLKRLHYYLFNIFVDSKHWKNFKNCIEILLHNSLSPKLNNDVNAFWPQLLEKIFEKHGNLSDFVGMWHRPRYFIWILVKSMGSQWENHKICGRRFK